MPIKFQLCSDIHMQSSTDKYNRPVPQKGKYLLLAGDIGSVGHPNSRIQHNHNTKYRTWLAEKCGRFERVFLIAGNHEYKQNTIQQGNVAMRGFEEHASMNGRLTVLEEGRFDLSDDGGYTCYYFGMLSMLYTFLFSRMQKRSIPNLDNMRSSPKGV